MAIKIDGDINQYIKLVGRSDESVKAEVQHIIDKLGCTPIIREIDKEFTGYDSSESFWLLHDAGVELRWKNDLLKGLSLYTQRGESSVSEYKPYAAALFTDFSNTATRDEIIRHLGTPANEANQNATWVRSAWVRYNHESGNWIHLQFDDDLHLKIVTLCVPIH